MSKNNSGILFSCRLNQDTHARLSGISKALHLPMARVVEIAIIQFESKKVRDSVREPLQPRVETPVGTWD